MGRFPYPFVERLYFLASLEGAVRNAIRVGCKRAVKSPLPIACKGVVFTAAWWCSPPCSLDTFSLSGLYYIHNK